MQQIYANTWDANQNPLAQTRTSQVNLDQLLFNSVYAESEIDPASDEDKDGLTYAQEARLGTDPTKADTDGDGLRDDAEVKGFDYQEKTWYSAPTAVDTNNDGLSDMEECPQRTRMIRANSVRIPIGMARPICLMPTTITTAYPIGLI